MVKKYIKGDIRKVRGNYCIKINEKGQTWKLLQIYFWEKLKGPIPKAHYLVCKTEDRCNVNPSNWRIEKKQKKQRPKKKYVPYKVVKTEKGWDREHRVNWEKEFGPIPKDKIVRFKDGDQFNTVAANLYLSTKEDMAKEMRIKLKLSDKFVAKTIGNNDKELREEVRNNRPLIEAKRQLLYLKRMLYGKK